MSKRSVCARVVTIIAFVLALGVAGTALAAPPDPTLGLVALGAKLDASDGALPGYFKTVDKGSTIETIPVTILAITGGSAAKSALIMFEATGPQIGKFGGIVAGMSGSPIYVDDGGVDKVVGAVSYGDYFTKGGTGLATPIESMRQIRSSYLPEFVNLAKPLVTTGGLVNSVIIAPNPADFTVQSKQGAFVANPLSSIFIGGLDPKSPGYKLLAKVLESRGQSVVPLSARLNGTPAVGDQTFQTPLVPGAAVGALAARGDMWIGGVGTVTYTDTDTVLAFGHPAFGAGPSSLFMTNAWVDGVWPSTYTPYKVARPTAVRGTIVQDRSAGILGVLDKLPAETAFTARAVDVDRGLTETSTVYMSRKLLDAGRPDPFYVLGIDPITAALGIYVAGQNLMDAQQTPGSADITTTVMATDGTTTYKVQIPNRVDSGYDIPLAVAQDAATAINTLQQVPTDGVHACSLLSVDLTARFTTRRNWAQVVGVELPEGLKAGANPVKVLALVYGKAATQTIDATLMVPSGSKLTGSVVAMSQAFVAQQASYQSMGGFGYSSGFFDPGVSISIPSIPSHTSLAEAVAGLNAIKPNGVVTVLLVPSGMEGSSEFESPYTLRASSVSTNVSADWAVGGMAQTTITQIDAKATPSPVNYGGTATITGSITGPSAGATVAVYATPVGGAETHVGTFTTSDGEGGVAFEAPVGPRYRNTRYRIRYDGSKANSAAETFVTIRARARVRLAASAKKVKRGRAITLKATVSPRATAGTRVVFEFNDRGTHWKTIATRTLARGAFSAKGSAKWKVAKGKHKVRVRYRGGTTNAPANSAAIVVTGK